MEFRREYLVRLPLPLAQLYSRAYNAKDGRSRHDNAFYLCESLVKLAAAPLIACYLAECEEGQPRVEGLDRLLAQLALPSLGQWLAMLRELARYYGGRADKSSHPLGHLWEQLQQPRKDAGLVALYRRIKNGVDGQPAGDQACSILQALDALVQYRNAVFGHGGPRYESFFANEMGPLMFPAINDLLADEVLNFLGPRGSRLVYLTEIRSVDEERREVGLRELVGLQGERLAPLTLSLAQTQALLPNRVAVLWPGRAAPLRLDPLLVYRESETAEEALFLNRDRNGRQVEYLSYTTGRTERDKSMGPALAALLSRVVRREVTEEELRRLTEQSMAETPSVEALLQPAPPAHRVRGDYEILVELGRGGMGVVYLARQLSLGRLVALKMLPTDLGEDEVALARFQREIRHLARCEHPNIIKVLSSGTWSDGQPYYTMEYVPGADLEKVWQELTGNPDKGRASNLGQTTWTQAVLSASRKRRQDAVKRAERTHAGDAPSEGASRPEGIVASEEELPLPPLPETLAPEPKETEGGYVRQVAAMVRDAALALKTVHEQQIVHRDVKPANLMLTADSGRVVLMDFGLAKGQSVALTASKQAGFLGTLRYSAPEQLASALIKVGPAADVRALGCVLWELLTRQRLFADAEDEAQLAAKVLNDDVPKLRKIDPKLDRDLEAIVLRATERDMKDRIQNAGELAEYLELYLEGKTLPIRTPGAREVMWRWVKKRKGVVSSAAAVLFAVIATTVVAFALIAAARDEAVGLAGHNARLAKDEAKARQEADEARKRTQAEREAADEARRRSEQAEKRTAKELRRAEGLIYGIQIQQAYDHLLNHDLVRCREFLDDTRRDLRGPDYGYVARRLQNWGFTLRGHTNWVSSLALSGDGKRLFSGSGDKTIKVWDLSHNEATKIEAKKGE